jgi:hypothetical protein
MFQIVFFRGRSTKKWAKTPAGMKQRGKSAQAGQTAETVWITAKIDGARQDRSRIPSQKRGKDVHRQNEPARPGLDFQPENGGSVTPAKAGVQSIAHGTESLAGSGPALE